MAGPRRARGLRRADHPAAAGRFCKTNPRPALSLGFGPISRESLRPRVAAASAWSAFGAASAGSSSVCTEPRSRSRASSARALAVADHEQPEIRHRLVDMDPGLAGRHLMVEGQVPGLEGAIQLLAQPHPDLSPHVAPLRSRERAERRPRLARSVSPGGLVRPGLERAGSGPEPLCRLGLSGRPGRWHRPQARVRGHGVTGSAPAGAQLAPPRSSCRRLSSLARALCA
jgi:hypothetical protein